FFSSRRRHTRFSRDWSSDVCSSDLLRQYASGLATPYCGPADGSPAAEWFEPGTRSLACMALRPDGGRNAFGILILGSEDAGRFKIGRASCRERESVCDVEGPLHE